MSYVDVPITGSEPCRRQDIDPDVFFPVSERDIATIAQAKAMCFFCGTREACLEVALAQREQHGIWGGKTATERASLLLQRAVAESEQSLHTQEVAS